MGSSTDRGLGHSAPERKPAVHVDAAAHAAVLAVTRGQPGIYNIAEDDGVVAIEKGPRRARLRSAVSARLVPFTLTIR